ncbi:unnamed protein product [Cladocopium goreaui]|uniref:Uncharacterized protein n=1 Tax=Cladocopium goreaui TaxID=2562237 RepID=A0A9P1DD74_9DINO|nr:unnamed protein product [Cladocopium goreaui]
MGLLGGYDSEEESEGASASASTKPSGAAASKPATTAQAEESSDEDDEPEAKRTKLTGPNPLGLLAPKFAQKDAGTKTSPTAAAMAFVPPQVRKKGRVVSTVTDNISDRSFGNSKSS